MALSCELLKKFKHHESPLCHKLAAAKTLLFGKEFYYICRKEELVLEWLLEGVSQESENKIPVLQTIMDCIKSDTMKNLRVAEIKSATIETLVKLLVQSLKFQTNSKSQKRQVIQQDSEDEEWSKEHCLTRECSVLIMENSIFLHYFRKNIDQYIELSHLILKSAAKSGNAEIFVRYLNSIALFQEEGLKKEDVYTIFIQKLYLPIIQTYCSLKKSINSATSMVSKEHFKTCENQSGAQQNVDIKKVLLHLIKRIIFPGSFNLYYKKDLQNLFENKIFVSRTQRMLCQILEKQILCNDNEVAVNLYAFIFEAFVHTFQNDFNAIFKFCVTMCVFLGFEPTIEIQESEKTCLLLRKDISKGLKMKISNPVEEFPFLVVKELLCSLKQVTVLLDETINEISFKTWIQALIIDSVITCKNPSLIFSILTSLIHLNPLIIEPIVSQVFQHVLTIPKMSQEERDNYKLFFIGIFNIFVKLHKIQNLIRFNLLPILKQVIENIRLTDINILGKLTAADIIPEEIKLTLSSTVEILSGQTCVSLLHTFQFFLTRDVIEPMEEGQFDGGHRLFLIVLEQLLVPYLEGVRLAEQTVLQPTCESFMESLVNLRTCLGRLGAALIHHEHCSLSLASYLRLCLAVGEVQILLLLYSPWSRQNSHLQTPLTVELANAASLQCLMSFLDPDQWSHLIKRAVGEGEGDKTCCECVNALLLQELRLLVLFENNIENSKEMQSTICDYLTESLKGFHLLQCSQNCAVLISLLPHEKLLSIADDISEHCAVCESDDEVHNLLKDPVLQENKSLLVSLAWTTVQKIGNLIVKRKRTHGSEIPDLGHRRLVKDMASSVEFTRLLSEKKKKIKQCFLEIAQKINETCEHFLSSDKTKKAEITQLDFKLLSRHLVVLGNLPLPFLPENTQIFLALGILGILIVVSEQTKDCSEVVHDKTMEGDKVKSLCKEILLGLVDGPTSPSLANFVKIGLVVRLLQRNGDCPKLLLEHLFVDCLEKPQHIHELTESVYLADTYVEVNVNPDAPLISASLLQLLMKKDLTNLSDDVRAIYKKDINYLLGIICDCIDRRVKSENISETCIHSLLEAFCVVLSSDSKTVMVLMPHTKKFVSAAFSDLDNPNASQTVVSMAELTLEVVMNHHERVGNDICKEMLWRVYKSNNRPELTAKLLKIVPLDDYVRVLQDFCHPLEGKKNKLIVFPDLRLPEKLVRISMPKSKVQKLDEMIVTVCSAAFEKILQGNSDDKLPEFLTFLFAIARRTKVPLPCDLADIILTTIICALKVHPMPLEYVLTNAPTILQLLLMLVLHHFPLIEERIPAFLQAYHMVVHIVVVRSSAKLQLNEEVIEKLARCALHIEQLTQAIGNYPKDFTVVSHHMVANLLQEFEKTPLHGKVKVHITNSLYELFKLCSKFEIAHLSHALSPASLELLRSVRSEYMKFYRYTGKV